MKLKKKNRKGSIRARDILISVIVVGFIAFSLFNYIGGLRTAYDIETNETFDESSLQATEGVADTVGSLKEDLEEADNVFSQTYILLFNGFKIAILSIISVFSPIFTMVYAVALYLNLTPYYPYILLLISITIIYTIWRALQGREGV